MDLNQITLPAADLDASLAFYQRLGLQLLVQSPHYARLRAPVGASTLSLHRAEPGTPAASAVLYFECGALDLRVAELQEQGLVFSQLPSDQPWLWREARLEDPFGNPLCLYRAAGMRLNPPWRVGGAQAQGLVAPVLHTPRLLLRPLQQDDLADFLRINSDAEVTRYLPYVCWQGLDDARAWYHRMQQLMLDGRMAYNAVVDRASGQVLGGALLRDLDGDPGKLEVGYVLGRDHWGRGLMREAVQALIGHAFAQPALRRIEAHIDARNTASQALVQGLGFQREALLRAYWSGPGADATIYGLLRGDWEAGR